ncbi:MAG TPA: hypothetical protein VFC77_13280 [Myxococcota bacterium]|nr:hypothetical protein [Myxococcota bacterium]
MFELRPDARAGTWRALALGLAAILSAMIGTDLVRAGAPAASCPCDARPAPRAVAAAPAPPLPPEWRWTPAVVPVDRMYGTPSPH